MDSSQKVTLSSFWAAKCEVFGANVVKGYAAGLTPSSRAVSSHGAEANIELQVKAKMAECAFCEWAGVSPQDLHWTYGELDEGYDVRFNQIRCDVKVTKQNNRYLIWPVNKRHIYANKPFDVLVLVKESAPTFWVSGWISKWEFWKKKKEATESHALTEGTWFVDSDELQDMSELTTYEIITPALSGREANEVVDYLCGILSDHEASAWMVRKNKELGTSPKLALEDGRIGEVLLEAMTHAEPRRSARKSRLVGVGE